MFLQVGQKVLFFTENRNIEIDVEICVDFVAAVAAYYVVLGCKSL